MKICISGWYFHEPFLQSIADSGYEALIVGHQMERDGGIRLRQVSYCGIPVVLTPESRGLDYGCYQQYLMEHWDGVSDVLFIQDDGEATGSAFDDIASIGEEKRVDHAFIFRDEYDEIANNCQSSRAMWFRGSALAEIKARGGFPVDWSNIGETRGKKANIAVKAFGDSISGSTTMGWVAIVPGLLMGRRGWISSKFYLYHRIEGSQGVVTPEGLK